MITFNVREERERIRAALGETISFDGRRVLVTGGAGFLGSWLCDFLIHDGAQVVCVDNLSSGRESNIADLRQSEHFRFIRHDITEPFDLDLHADFVFHMASRASPFEFEHYPLEILKANTFGILTSLEIAKQCNSAFVYTSTSEVYGNPSVVPTPESYFGNVNCTGIRGCYDEAKRCGEAYVMAYLRQYRVNARIARIFNTYGPRIRMDGIYGRVIPRFIDQALANSPLTVFGDGLQTRSFTYVTDQIEGLLRLATAERARGEVINIGNVNEITVLDLARKVISLTDSESPLAFNPLPADDPTRRRPDITKAREILSWEPKVSLENGLGRTIAWIREEKARSS